MQRPAATHPPLAEPIEQLPAQPPSSDRNSTNKTCRAPKHRTDMRTVMQCTSPMHTSCHHQLLLLLLIQLQASTCTPSSISSSSWCCSSWPKQPMATALRQCHSECSTGGQRMPLAMSS